MVNAHGAESAPKTKWTYYLNVAIGLFFMLGFPLIQPVEPLTELGMLVLGVLIGMVYLWSTTDSIWPSLLGLLLVSLGGIVPDLQGYAAVKDVFMNAFGAEVVLFLIIGTILFAGFEYVGCTKYIARFFMTRKIIEGRPYVFFFMLFFCSYILSGVCNPMAAMLILWPIVIDVCETFGYKKGDKIFYVLVCGVYLAATLGQPMLPFKGAPYAIINAFQNMSGIQIGYSPYIAFSFIMGLVLLLLFLVFVRFIVRPDVEKFKAVTVEEVNKTPLDKINGQQIVFMFTILFFALALLLPNFLPATVPGVPQLNKIGLLGVTSILIIVLMVIPYKGGRLLDYHAIAKKSFNWNLIYLVAAAMYICSAVTNEGTGIKPFLVQLFNPLLGGKPEFLFILIILTVALLLTNVGNNTGMAIIIMPVILAYGDQYPGIDMTALCVAIMLIVFVAVLTPAASPYCSMLHGRKDLVSFKEIISLFWPMVVVAVIVYAIIGYPFASVLF